MAVKTLFDVLKECLQDDKKATVYEAKVVRELILADGEVSPQERLLLEQALHKDKFDEQAVQLLSRLLLRADCNEFENETEHGKGSCC